MNIKELNKEIVNIILETSKFSKGTKGGHKLEDLLAEELSEKLKGFKLISGKSFKEDYSEYKKKCSNVDFFDFKNIEIKSGYQDDKLIIEQPKGSQNSPDILIIYNKVGLPIECKTSKDDKITWNSGYPRDNYIYVFNKYKGSDSGTTFFMGQDIITSQMRKELLNQSEKNKIDSNLFNMEVLKKHGNDWSLYARPMFNSNIKYFKDKEIRKIRENNVINFLEKFRWK